MYFKSNLKHKGFCAKVNSYLSQHQDILIFLDFYQANDEMLHALCVYAGVIWSNFGIWYLCNCIGADVIMNQNETQIIGFIPLELITI